jgi:Na+-translocating ferredoxin:NAD+ oxidoreductase RNF subunit RnfB
MLETLTAYTAGALVVLGALALVSSVALAVANRFFSVRVDPRQVEIEEVLPKANCGACGYGGCAAYAEALVEGKADANLCIPGGADVAAKVARILGVAVGAFAPKVAVILCQGSREVTGQRFRYVGQPDCRAAAATQYGPTACSFACLGLGSCVRACPFDAMVMDAETGLPRVLEDRCTACGTCAEVCPKNVIAILPKDQHVHVLCRNQESGRVTRQVCKVGCIACKRCEKVCPVEGSAIHVKDNVATVDAATCIQCGKCVKECPVGCIGNFREWRRRADKAKGAKPEEVAAA